MGRVSRTDKGEKRFKLLRRRQGRRTPNDLCSGLQGCGFLTWEFVFPARDDYGGQAVAEDIYSGAAHVHELIDGEEEEERLGGEMEGRGGGENDDERGAGYAGRAFAADEQREEHDRILLRREVDVRCLRDAGDRQR